MEGVSISISLVSRVEGKCPSPVRIRWHSIPFTSRMSNLGSTLDMSDGILLGKDVGARVGIDELYEMRYMKWME